MFVLYTYNHCPYCVRARMIFAFHHIAYKNKILANDDEQTPIQLIGEKKVPILIKENGEAMAESLDIVDYIDQYAQREKGKKPLARFVREEIKQWLQDITQYSNRLIMPRVIKICSEDFPTQSAIDYFTAKKQKMIGDFAENLANSEDYINQANKDLRTLEPLIEHAVSLQEQVSMEDILVFPILRNLTMVKGIAWPDDVKQYAQAMAQQTNLGLFFAQAL